MVINKYKDTLITILLYAAVTVPAVFLLITGGMVISTGWNAQKANARIEKLEREVEDNRKTISRLQTFLLEEDHGKFYKLIQDIKEMKACFCRGEQCLEAKENQ